MVCAFIHDGMVFQFFLQHRHHERHIYGHQRCQIISDEQYVVDETDQSSNFPLFNFQSSISYWFSQLKPRITSQAMHCTSYNIFTHTHIFLQIRRRSQFAHLDEVHSSTNIQCWNGYGYKLRLGAVLCFPVYRCKPQGLHNGGAFVMVTRSASSWKNHLPTDSQLFTRWKDRMVKDL